MENADGIKVIDPTQFNYIARTPVNPLLIPMYIVKAFIKRVDIMLVILFSGGAFHMLTQSGALQAVIAKLAKKFSNNLYVFIPILTPDVWSDLYHPGCKTCSLRLLRLW